jgi:hypothetical protein
MEKKFKWNLKKKVEGLGRNLMKEIGVRENDANIMGWVGLFKTKAFYVNGGRSSLKK